MMRCCRTRLWHLVFSALLLGYRFYFLSSLSLSFDKYSSLYHGGVLFFFFSLFIALNQKKNGGLGR